MQRLLWINVQAFVESLRENREKKVYQGQAHVGWCFVEMMKFLPILSLKKQMKLFTRQNVKTGAVVAYGRKVRDNE